MLLTSKAKRAKAVAAAAAAAAAAMTASETLAVPAVPVVSSPVIPPVTAAGRITNNSFPLHNENHLDTEKSKAKPGSNRKRKKSSKADEDNDQQVLVGDSTSKGAERSLFSSVLDQDGADNNEFRANYSTKKGKCPKEQFTDEKKTLFLSRVEEILHEHPGHSRNSAMAMVSAQGGPSVRTLQYWFADVKRLESNLAPRYDNRRANKEFEREVLSRLIINAIQTCYNKNDEDENCNKSIKSGKVFAIERDVISLIASYERISKVAKEVQTNAIWMDDVSIQGLHFSSKWCWGFANRNLYLDKKIHTKVKECLRNDVVDLIREMIHQSEASN